MFSLRKGFHSKTRKNRHDPGTGLVDPGATARRCCRRRRLCLGLPPPAALDAMDNPGRRRPPWLVAEVLGTSQLPDSFVRDLSARCRLTGPNGEPLSTNLLKARGIHAFLELLTAEAAPVPGLAKLTLLGMYRDGRAHIFHSLFSVLVGPYNPDRRLFGCRGELPPEGLPAITDIPVASFGELRVVSAVSRDDHRVHLEGFLPSVCQKIPCKRAIRKEEGQSLTCRGVTFFPPDAAAPLFYLEGSIGDFSKQLFPLLVYREPSYKEAIDWIQFTFTGDTKRQYAAPAHTTFSFSQWGSGD